MGANGSTTHNYKNLDGEEEQNKFWAQVPLFQCLPRELHPQLTACSEKVEFETGHVIIKQGEQGNEFFVIKSGTALIEVDGSKLTMLSTGDYFGEGALLANEPRTATITAVTPIEALKITRADFQELRLHERLQFPKREKINRRHRMMAAGASGKADDKNKRASARNMRVVFAGGKPDAPKKTYCEVQRDALAEIFGEYLNMSAFLLVPAGLAVQWFELSQGIIFLSNFLAIVPLASILGASTEALSVHTGQLIGGLLNATFGNAVEMIMCIQAVKAGLIDVVQGNLLGSVLSNLLLVLGMAVFASGMVRKKQTFNAQGAAANMTCQLVASISICLPTVFASVSEQAEEEVLAISRICSVFLMTVYGMFLYFMLKTHADFFADEESNEEEEEGLSPTLSLILLGFCTLAVFFCTECLVDSIEGVSEKYGLSKAFIGVILLPIVGNAAEHATAVTCAYKGLMDLALGVAVGSSTQIALFVVPCSVMFGWFFDQPMNLNFTVFDTTCQMLTVFLVSQVLAHGETNWLHGAMLMTVYCFIAVQTLFISNGVGS